MPDAAARANHLTLTREVSATRAEFRHGLAQAFPHGVEEDGNCFRLSDGTTALEIELTPQPSRHIAALCLPVLRVAIRFTAGSPAQQQALLARLDRAMHRGGG